MPNAFENRQVGRPKLLYGTKSCLLIIYIAKAKLNLALIMFSNKHFCSGTAHHVSIEYCFNNFYHIYGSGILIAKVD